VVKGVDPNPWALLFLLNRDRLIVDATHFAAAVSAEGVAMSKVIPELARGRRIILCPFSNDIWDK